MINTAAKIISGPFCDDAYTVFRNMDLHDWREAEVTRGTAQTSLGLFSDWRSVEGYRVLSQVIYTRQSHVPIAVLGVSNTGVAGVAEAALVARDHKRYARDLARLAVAIKQQLPAYCETTGIHRIEARCWADHPTAAIFLTKCGFRQETMLKGFGAGGRETFIQFAWTKE